MTWFQELYLCNFCCCSLVCSRDRTGKHSFHSYSHMCPRSHDCPHIRQYLEHIIHPTNAQKLISFLIKNMSLFSKEDEQNPYYNFLISQFTKHKCITIFEISVLRIIVFNTVLSIKQAMIFFNNDLNLPEFGIHFSWTFYSW